MFGQLTWLRMIGQAGEKDGCSLRCTTGVAGPACQLPPLWPLVRAACPHTAALPPSGPPPPRPLCPSPSPSPLPLQEELRRYNYVTPKNYLDFINNYKRALATNRKTIQASCPPVRPPARPPICLPARQAACLPA